MTGDRPRFWVNVRPVFHKYFQFWPDHEDLIWAKTVWPIMENAGLYSDHDEEASNWTQCHIAALAILYAESAWRFGTPDYKRSSLLDRGRLALTFGSQENLDSHLWTVGRTISEYHQIDHWSEGNADLLLPLFRSLVTGGGFYTEGAALSEYLNNAWERHPEVCEFREDELHQMWVGGHFASNNMMCFS